MRLLARRVVLGVTVALGGSLSAGCVVVEKRRPTYVAVPVARPACHPSQYWDGAQCRHKGKGHGARKHDGRGKAK